MAERIFLPNSTLAPDVFYDHVMGLVTPAEWKVLGFIVRRTYGFGKPADAISVTQFCTGIRRKDGTILTRGCDLSRPTVIDALARLIRVGLVLAEQRRGQTTVYRLNLDGTPAIITALKAERDARHAAYIKEGSKRALPVNDVYQSTSLTGTGKAALPPASKAALPTRNTVTRDTTEEEAARASTRVIASLPPSSPLPKPSPPPPLPPEVREKLDAMHAVLLGCRGYQPTEAMLRTIGTKYGGLDLEEEAVKIAGWLDQPQPRHRKQPCSAAFILNWLKKTANDRPSPNGRSTTRGQPTDTTGDQWQDNRQLRGLAGAAGTSSGSGGGPGAGVAV